jgi:hypothetical protein
MVNYAGGDPIFEEEDVFEPVDVATGAGGFPTVLSSQFFPEAPTLSGITALEKYAPLLLDEESYLKRFATPVMTDEQIEKAFKPSDTKDLRNLAIARLGFSLMQPTEGGRIGPAISKAGQQLTSDLMQIKQAQKKEQKAAEIGMINAKMKRDAQQILDRKGVFDLNRQVLTTIAGKEYDATIAADKAKMDLFKAQVQAATSKFMDYQLEGVKPKKVQVAIRDAEGGVGDAFTAFVVQSLAEDGSLNAPQYYRPTNELGADGMPQMELITNPENIVEISLAKTGTPDDFASKSGVTKFQDVLSSLQTKDRAILTLDQLEKSLLERPGRAGFLAGIQKRFNSYAQIFSDAYNYQFNNFFNEDKTLSDGRQIKKGEKFQNLASTLNIYLNDPKLQKDLERGIITQEEYEGLIQANNAFEQLGVVGRAQMAAEYNKSGGKDKYGQDLFESDEQKQMIYNKLGFFDTELPANEVRANSIIYAIARARKSSGRLNLDDIERAAKDLNIYGDSSVDVLTKIKILKDQLVGSRTDDLAQIQLIFPDYYTRMIEQGYGAYDGRRTTELVGSGAIKAEPQEFNYVITEEGLK